MPKQRPVTRRGALSPEDRASRVFLWNGNESISQLEMSELGSDIIIIDANANNRVLTITPPKPTFVRGFFIIVGQRNARVKFSDGPRIDLNGGYYGWLQVGPG